MRILHSLRKVTLLLRRIRGGILVGEVLRRRVASGRERVTVSDVDGSLTMHLDLGEHMQSQIFWYGSYSREIVFLLKRLLKPGMVCIDGGANIGEITLIAAKCVGAGGRVIAFEPVAAFADQLERNVQANRFEQVELYRFGLSDEPGEAAIYVTQEACSDGTTNDGLGSLFPSEKRSSVAQTVPLMTLDNLLERGVARVDLVKLDIEGGELAALRGARRLIETYEPDFIVEIGEETCRAAGYKGSDILEFLGGFGYQFHRIGRKGTLEPIGASDLLDFQNVYCSKGGGAGRKSKSS